MYCGRSAIQDAMVNIVY